MSRILDASATSRLTMHEHGDGTTTLVQSTDVSAALRRNEQLRRHGMTKTQDGDHLLASIPIDLLNSWGLKKYGVGWEIISADDKKLDEFIAAHRKVQIHGAH